MYTLFFVCATIGGAVFLFQFIMAALGAGMDAFDIADDIPDGMDAPDGVDIPGDIDVGHDVGIGHDVTDAQGDVIDHGSTWFFSVLTFRTVVSALLFFGLGGIGALEAKLSPQLALLIALAAGAAAMYGVHYLMRTLFRLRHDGTVQIQQAVGQRGTVYIPIPPNNEDVGKIQVQTQGRIMEYAATTASAERLVTGTPVEVVRILSPSLLEVEPISESVTMESQEGKT